MENLNLITINKNMKLETFDCGNKYINDFLIYGLINFSKNFMRILTLTNFKLIIFLDKNFGIKYEMKLQKIKNLKCMNFAQKKMIKFYGFT